MKFSIVITTYNRVSLLQRAVESCLNQSIPCEVVIADDGSTDGTEEYAKSLGSRVVYHRNPVNCGHSETVNAGVRAAQGDWIKLLDDDDYLSPHCIEKMAAAIAARPQAAICSTQAIQVDGNGTEISRTQPSGPGAAFYIPQEDIHYGMLLEMVPFGTPVQVAFTRDAFLQSGGWDSSFDGNSCDDIYSWLQIARYGDALFINNYLAYRTIWPGSGHKKLSLQKQLETNILIKEKIYPLVSEKHRAALPQLSGIRGFLKLHWAMAGLKQRKVLTALAIAYPALFSPTAWKMLFSVIYARKINRKAQYIRQEVIPEERLNVAQNTSNSSEQAPLESALTE
jgi:hypothetical protein